MNKQLLQSLGYKVNERTFEEVEGFFRPKPIDPTLFYEKRDIVYSGAEHKGNPKLPNLTILPNLRTKGLEIILGTTFGHQHNQMWQGDTRRFQEIYEFQGYGAMLLRNSDSTTLYLLKPGEKVLVGTGDNMTMFNLQEEPLVTLDYANPQMNEADKVLEKRIGSMLIISAHPQSELAEFSLNKSYYGEYVKTKPPILPLVLHNATLGEKLYQEILKNDFLFKIRGIDISTNSNIPEELKTTLSQPLLNLALTQNPILMQELMIGKDNNTFKGNLIYDESGYPVGTCEIK